MGHASRLPRAFLALAALSCVAASGGVAAADEKAVCLDASERGQTLKIAHQLVEAREQLRTCARAECPPLLQKACDGWLEAVEKSIPTVVVSAKNAAGSDLVNVTVTVDGRPFLTKLAGAAMPMNPGDHLLHFESTEDGTSRDERVVTKEGEQNRSIAVVLGGAIAPPSTPSVRQPALVTVPEPTATTSTWRTVGWATGGLGVVGVAIGTVFGVIAVVDKNGAGCNSAGQCQAGPLSDTRTAARVSDVGLIAGGVLAAGGLCLVLFAPHGHPDRQAAIVRLAPDVGPGREGLALEGAW